LGLITTRKCVIGSTKKGHEIVDFVCWFGHIEADSVHQKIKNPLIEREERECVETSKGKVGTLC